MWTYTQPVKIIFGNESLALLADQIEQMGLQRGLLVTSRHFETSGFAAKLIADKNNRLVNLFADVQPNPHIDTVDACAQIIRANHIDFVVALGGGSVIDCAKAAACIATQEGSVKKYYGTGTALPPYSVPVIAVPTTAGTGSEVTGISVLSDGDFKRPVSGEVLFPKLAIVDPKLTYSLPKHTVASSGIDALSHALEAYWSIHHQPVSDSLAVSAAQLIFEYLPVAYNEPNNAKAREKLSEASLLAGLAFVHPRTTASHACSFPLTARLGIDHGEACGLTLDYFARYNGEKDGRIDELAKKIGFSDYHELTEKIKELKLAVELITDLKYFHISEEEINTLAQQSIHPNLYNNPVPVSEDDLKHMYQSFL